MDENPYQSPSVEMKHKTPTRPAHWFRRFVGLLLYALAVLSGFWAMPFAVVIMFEIMMEGNRPPGLFLGCSILFLCLSLASIGLGYCGYRLRRAPPETGITFQP
jgi:hypothetical protein